MPSATLERLRAFLGLPSSSCCHLRLSLDVGRDLVGGRIQILDWCLDCGALRIRDEQEDVSSDWVIPSENAEARNPAKQSAAGFR